MVQIHLSNTNVTDWMSHMSDGWDNFKRGFSGTKSTIQEKIFCMKNVESYERISLKGRIKLIAAGIGLMIPGINMIVYWALHKEKPHGLQFGKVSESEFSPPASPSEEKPAGVQFGKQRVREFNKAAPTHSVADLHSIVNSL